MMLGVGTLVGAGFALLIYAMAVIGLPLLLDREVDFITAMITSIGAVRAAPLPLLCWGVFIAVLTFVAMIPGFLGLFLVLPWLGHASWHLYRQTDADRLTDAGLKAGFRAPSRSACRASPVLRCCPDQAQRHRRG